MVRTLVCLPEVPNPRVSGGYGRNVAIAQALAQLDCEVTVLAFTSQRDGGATQLLAQSGITVYALDRDPVDPTQILGAGFDVVFLTYYELAEQLMPAVRALAPGARVVIDSVDLHYLRMLRQAEVESDAAGVAQAEAVRRRELAIYSRADVLLTVSEREQETLSELMQGIPVGVVPSVHRADPGAPGAAGRRGALFVGAYNFPPNRDAAGYLCQEIMPRLRASGYEDPVSLVGPYLDDQLAQRVREAGAEPVGFVPDLGDLYAQRRVFLSPVRFGSGIKTKVGEALGAGLPVVGTTLGTEGFPLHEAITRSDDPDALVRAVLRLADDTIWDRESRAGRELIATSFGPDRCERELAEVLEYLLAGRSVAA